MNVELIYKVFEVVDKELKQFLTQEEFHQHVTERAIEFCVALNRINQSSVYSEFMAK